MVKGKTLQGDSAHDDTKGSCVDGEIGNFFLLLSMRPALVHWVYGELYSQFVFPFVDAAGLCLTNGEFWQ